MLELSKKYLNTPKETLIFEDIKPLQELIKYHSDLYYNKESPVISDVEYDELFEKLKFIEEKFNLNIKQTSFVGAEIIESTFEKVKHSRPMISLDNTYNTGELRDFDIRLRKILEIGEKGKIEYTLEYKFDGLGVELIYKNGVFVRGITRGNGIEGEDVTQNLKEIKNIPKKINYKEDLEVRGEVIMPISSFERLNKEAKEKGEKIFSNPRNAASGSVRMKNTSITKERDLKFYAYDLANFEEFRISIGLTKYYDIIKSLEKFGFSISNFFKVYNGINNVINEIENYKKEKIDFDVDGLVLKVNDIVLWNDVGWTEHHPRYAVAYKFPAEIVTTKIISVDHQVGKTGTITPVANLEPVNISGVVVKRATLHNYEEVEDLDVRIGDTVFIKRAGEVIPKIISVVNSSISTSSENNIGLTKRSKKGKRGARIFPPKFCPSCGAEVKKDKNKVRYYCPNNIDCPAQHTEKLIFAVGKQGFNIDGLGKKQVELFLNEGIIHNIVDIFKVEKKKDEILLLEGFKEKSVNNLISALEKAKNQDIVSFLIALGITGVGRKTAKIISKLFTSKNDLLNFPYTLEEIGALYEIGPELAKNIFEYFQNEAHKRILGELVNVLNIKYYEKKNISGNFIFKGKKVCITGSFKLDGKKVSRDELIKKLEEVGGEFVSSVSKKTDFLLAGENAGSKREKAEKLKVEIVDLTYFLNNL